MTERMKTLVSHLEDVVEQQTRELEVTNQKLQLEIRKRRQAEKEKAHLENELRKAYQKTTNRIFCGGFAFEFNNAFSAIVGHTELAMDDLPSENPAQHNLKEVLKAARRLKDLVRKGIDNALNIQRRSVVGLNDLLDETVEYIREIKLSTVTVDVDIKDSAVIHADPKEIRQMLINLCINAAQAMEEHGGVLSISLGNVELSSDDLKAYEVRIPGTYAVIEVKDNGEGIDPENMERIFEPFFTTKDAVRASGLGLSVVYGIVKNHGGMVHVTSEKHKGSIFTVYLPATGKVMKLCDSLPMG